MSSLNDRGNLRKADISSTDDEIAHLEHKLDAAVEAIGVPSMPMEPPFTLCKGNGDPLKPWALEVIRDHPQLTKADIVLLWYFRECFNRINGRWYEALGELAESICVDGRSLRRAIKHSEARGHLYVDRVAGGGRGKANGYGPALWTQNRVSTPPLSESEKQGVASSETGVNSVANRGPSTPPTCNTLYTFARQSGDTSPCTRSRRAQDGAAEARAGRIVEQCSRALGNGDPDVGRQQLDAFPLEQQERLLNDFARHGSQSLELAALTANSRGGRTQ